MVRRRNNRKRKGGNSGTKRNGKSMMNSRVLQSVSARTNPDPSGTNYITRRPFSYKVTVALDPASTTVKSNYTTIFPDLNTTAITRVRLDKVSVWGSSVPTAPTIEKTVYLEVGDDFSRSDQPGANQRACITCIPRLIDGGANEDTIIKFTNADLIHLQGVVYVRRASQPTTPFVTFDARDIADSPQISTGMAAVNLKPPSFLNS